MGCHRVDGVAHPMSSLGHVVGDGHRVINEKTLKIPDAKRRTGIHGRLLVRHPFKAIATGMYAANRRQWEVIATYPALVLGQLRE